MKFSHSFTRIFFLLIAISFATTFVVGIAPTASLAVDVGIGLTFGGILGGVFLYLENTLNRSNLLAFNVRLLGLTVGYLMGLITLAILNAALSINQITLPLSIYSLVQGIIFLSCMYTGLMVTVRSSEEIYVSIPFVRFQPTSDQKKDVLIDASVLADTRIIDLSSSGILDHHLVLPRFILKELQEMTESEDETIRSKARRCLEVIKKLEALPSLCLRYSESDFPEIRDPMSKLVRLARLLDANILTADISRVQESSIEGIRVINIHSLSNFLKPLTQAGEYLKIKIQRYGKEERQGVGYLDDGTMVVVNGGAEFIGETIKALVLSVKHTSSGRMIFCNATEETVEGNAEAPASEENAGNHKNYFAVES